jgi:murein L,D-transpeptidase YcbB/YkuD
MGDDSIYRRGPVKPSRREALSQAGAAFAALVASPAIAQDWNPFRDTTGAVGKRHDAYDKEFVREWEARPPPGYATLSPNNIEATKAAIKRYSDIVREGGWPVVPDVQMQAGSSGQAVGVLRARLMISGDLREQGNFRDYFDNFVERAVKRFQASNGLSPTGIVDKRTVVALNIPAQARLKQLQANLPRLSELQRSLPRKYIVVNIPAQQIEAVENGIVVSRHAGVVGKIDRPTPILRSSVHELNFNPVWHLPPTVIEKDLIPKGRDMQRSGRSVLAQYGIDAYDGSGRKLDPDKIDWSSPSARGLTFRQQPGKENPLGFVKINFHNQHAVYMHDTPSDGLFSRNFRAASSGCVRVGHVEQLAAWILAENGDWPVSRVLDMKRTGARQDVRVRRPVPLYFAYISAWATEDGVVQFRRDLYQRDGLGAVASAY